MTHKESRLQNLLYNLYFAFVYKMYYGGTLIVFAANGKHFHLSFVCLQSSLSRCIFPRKCNYVLFYFQPCNS
ncbi:hypothetical protein CW304_13915 [Bacillus sp. UFRGS-B20]|nr:hypothetical protein CW304_13915 [Bacillus sp. UFRGS-B20]